MIYLASPYTHENKEIEELRFREICRVAADLIYRGMIIYSPIAHCHPIAKTNNLSTSYKYWKIHNIDMLHLAKKLMVCKMEGWEGSVGVQNEIQIAKELGLEIEYI